MANSILPIVPIKEEYPKAIRESMTKLESRFEKEAKKMLKPVQDIILEYARGKTLLLAKNTTNLRDLLTTNLFLLSPELYKELYEQGINYSNELIDRQVNNQGIKTENIGINLKLKPEEVRYIDQINLRRQELAKVLQETTVDKAIKTIENGVRDGLSFDDIAEKLKTNIGVSGSRATIIARTETNWAMNDGQRLNMQRLGITEFTVSYAGDACPICTSAFQNNKKYPIGQKGLLPLHNCCRCILLSVIPTEWLKVSEQIDEQQAINKASKIKEEETRLSQKQELSNLEKENQLKEKINQLGEKLQQLEKTIKNVKSDSIEKEQLNKSIQSISQ